MSIEPDSRTIVIRGTEIVATDESRIRLQKLARITLDSMVQFVGLLDADGTVLEINKVALDAVGIKLSDVEGKPFWTSFWWQVSDEVNTTLRESIARAARGESVRWDTPIYGRAGGKETIIIDASLCPVMDDDGNVVFICAEGRDISQKKAQERELAQKNIELQGLLERIRELDEIKTQFFANVSHELRTPLALILGPAQRLIEDDGTMEFVDRRESAQVIARNARMLLKHVSDLLDMSRIEAGKLRIELRDTDVAALVRFLASHFAVLATDRGIDFAVEADEVCIAAVDPDKLQRVLMNLLGNAFKFVPDGGHIRCSLAQAGDRVTMAVDDSGPGVRPELRNAIFERFRQGDGGIDRKVGGTGLGLAIAKEFVEMHKGLVEVVDSELGGARFQVVLPLHRMSTAGLAAANAPVQGLDRAMIEGLIDQLRPLRVRAEERPARSAVGLPRILVVEDNPDMNRFIVQSLEGAYEVIPAFDGREGIEQALRHCPTVIVSDIMMPNVSGVEMIAEMRRLPELESTPILLLSAKADEQLMVRLLDDGAQDFIVKPFSERDLQVRVRNLVLSVRAREQLEVLRETAESANRAKDEFIAMLGHELRNPLSPIVTALQLIKLQRYEHSELAYTIIERQVSHLTRLVDDLLDVARIARGKVELKLETIDLAEVVAKAIEMAGPLLEQQKHVLTVEVPKRGLAVNGDAIRLSQVVSNLLTNAAKYTPSGGGRITVVAERIGDAVVLRVKDTGIGIAPEILPRIFELFIQDRQASDRSLGGLGIGLTIVRNLVEGHGGTVSAQSAGPGRGSEFEIRLPAAPPAAVGPTVEADSPPVAPARNSRLRILVVDDNVDGAVVLARTLTLKGHSTVIAHDALSALALAVEWLPDVAVVDIGLPVMDGYELAMRLRQIPQLASLHLVALTGYGQESDRRKSREAGFGEHLVKPVDLEELESALKPVMDGGQALERIADSGGGP